MSATPPLLCAFSLGRNGYCTEFYLHRGEHRCDPALMPGQTTPNRHQPQRRGTREHHREERLMGREVRRVPLDFDWPLEQLWEGYLMPARLRGTPCATCAGSGSSDELEWLMKVGYILAGLADDHTDAERGRPMHPWLTTLREISYGSRSQRPGPRFAEFVDGLTESKVDPDRLFGRAVYRMTGALREAAGLPDEWGWCPDCAGQGETETHPGQRGEAEAWEPTDPPEGEGWQLWSTTTEGHPMTPVFATAEALADHCAAESVSWFGREGAPRDQWLRSFVGDEMVGMVWLGPNAVIM